MKNVTYFFILFLLTLTTPLFADKNSNEEVLKRLDRVIDNKTACHVQKEKEIVDLKQRLHRSKDNREKYELCGSLFNAYLHYQADSALYYINGKMNLLPLLNHPELKNEIVINRAEVMGVMGMYNEALEQLERVDTRWNWNGRLWLIITGPIGLIMVGWPIIPPMMPKK